MVTRRPPVLRPKPLDARALARWPLPSHGDDADKDARGRVLIVAGSEEVPGAALLAAVAALRAGAGKLTVAAPRSVAQGLALAIPEARVIPMPQGPGGALQTSAARYLQDLQLQLDAVVLGPGMLDERRSMAFVRAALPTLGPSTVVLDAVAMSVAREEPFAKPVLLTPHAGEMAHLMGVDKEEVSAQPARAALEGAQRWNAVIALKGPSTYLATPQGELWCFAGGSAGLGTSGSGDTLAGVIGGLAARGLPSVAAAAWGMTLHARAGAALARRYGPLGYLARELSAELPALLHQATVGPRQSRRTRRS